MWSADKAAKAIVEAVSRGESYITLPKLYSSLMFFKYVWLELVEWHFRRSKFVKLTRFPWPIVFPPKQIRPESALPF